jgi:hypothetical protein
VITYRQFLNENELSIETSLYSKLEEARKENLRFAVDVEYDKIRPYDARERETRKESKQIEEIETRLARRYKFNNLTELIEVCIRELDEEEWIELDLTPEEELLLIKYKPEGIIRFNEPFPATQEYIFTHRPDLTGKVKNVDLNLRKRFSHELNLDKVQI